MSIFGTRPEAIKLASVIREIRQRENVESIVCVTAQHREMLDQVLDVFHIKPDYDLDLMNQGQTPLQVWSSILKEIPKVINKVKPDWVIVQGDTTTVAATGLAGFHNNIPIAHVEAGLRTGRMDNPFPEEFNRRLVSLTATLNFAPTIESKQNLLNEGIPPERVIVTGNTVVDTLNIMAEKSKSIKSDLIPEDSSIRLILLTLHRRESFGETFIGMLEAIRELAERFGPAVRFVYPVHPNPNIRKTAYKKLSGLNSVILVEPMDYVSFLGLMSQSYLVLTDSGGVQEECPSLGVPVVVLRDRTERPEGIKSGCARLAGTGKNNIVSLVTSLLTNPLLRENMVVKENPYGDGRAAQRIVDALLNHADLAS